VTTEQKGNRLEHVEELTHEGVLLALIIRGSYVPEQTVFVTPSEHQQQVGFVVYPQGGCIDPHTHRPIERHIRGTSEVVLVKQGKCEVDIFTNDKKWVTRKLLQEGDILVFLNAGHAFRMLEATVLLEVKQGPYLGNNEKERF